MLRMMLEHRRARRSPPAVLIVEDDALVAEAAAEALGSAGYRTICAGDAWQALDALERERPAVMLVDLFLPGMSGSELLRIVKASPAWSHVPRVIMTGANDPMIRVREDADVLYKPLDLDTLLQVIRRYCDRSRPQLAVLGDQPR
jgi:CheY-like chemotaxis protein